jgi:hypothetical protein
MILVPYRPTKAPTEANAHTSMKRHALILWLVLVTTSIIPTPGCAGRPLTGIPGESLTDSTLRRDTYRNIGIIEKARNGSINHT